MNKLSAAEIAGRQRHLYLLQKVRDLTPLTAAELRELKKYEMAGKGKMIPAVPADEREAQRRLMARKRAAVRDVRIPAIKNPRRRARCKKSPELFCRTYYPNIFYNPFTDDQVAIITAITERVKYGGYQAIAAERGGGKSSIAKVVSAVWGVVYGYVRYLLLLGANGPLAEGMLEDIKSFYEFNDLLAEDFPEVCCPVRALEGAAQRAGGQTVLGERTRLKWSGREIVFPYIKYVGGRYSASSGAVVTSRGVDSAIRGLVRGELRPNLVICDDLETRESVRSLVETQKRKSTLESDVLGLAGPGKRMPVLFLGTIIRRGCLIDQFTDRKKNPAWHGLKQKRLIQKPSNVELWSKYIELRQKGQLEGDATARVAHGFYLENRLAMETGAVVSNPYRYHDDPINKKQTKSWYQIRKVKASWRRKKGMKRLSALMEQAEVSALQACYNDIADMGPDSFAAEYQNQPPAEVVETSGIEVSNVQKKLSGFNRGVVPKDCLRVTLAVDVGRRRLHWAAAAWGTGAVGYIIEYGTEEVNSPMGDLKDEGIRKGQEEAILTALLVLRDRIGQTGFAIAESDETRGPDLCLVDCGWLGDPVYQFCAAGGRGTYRPSRGFGTNSRQGKYRRPAKAGQGGSHWHITLKPGTRKQRYDLDVDYYKQRVHDGFLTPAGQNGNISLFGDDPIRHRGFAEQILAEIWTRDFVAGRGWKEGWQVRHRRNHYLDVTAANIAAAEILGLRLVSVSSEEVTRRRKKPQAKRQTARQRIRTRY